jgi:hypothetical protein
MCVLFSAEVVSAKMPLKKVERWYVCEPNQNKSRNDEDEDEDQENEDRIVTTKRRSWW